MKKILLIEDYQPTVEMINLMLKMQGYEVEIAYCGKEGLQKAAAADLILLDVMMPEMDGLEVCRRLKSADSTKHIPVIIVSIRADDLGKEGREIGAAAYLAKPFEPERLLDLIKKHLPG
ncbi:MAG: response regulator [Candidatus Margulisiibacteriota bacterium]|jgi:DNA-binding response OmpR family regulator